MVPLLVNHHWINHHPLKAHGIHGIQQTIHIQIFHIQGQTPHHAHTQRATRIGRRRHATPTATGGTVQYGGIAKGIVAGTATENTVGMQRITAQSVMGGRRSTIAAQRQVNFEGWLTTTTSTGETHIDHGHVAQDGIGLPIGTGIASVGWITVRWQFDRRHTAAEGIQNGRIGQGLRRCNIIAGSPYYGIGGIHTVIVIGSDGHGGQSNTAATVIAATVGTTASAGKGCHHSVHSRHETTAAAASTAVGLASTIGAVAVFGQTVAKIERNVLQTGKRKRLCLLRSILSCPAILSLQRARINLIKMYLKRNRKGVRSRQ